MLLHEYDKLRDLIKKDKCWWRDSVVDIIEQRHLTMQALDFAEKYGGLISGIEDYRIAFPPDFSNVETENLMAVSDAARRVGCTRETLYKAINAKQIKIYHVDYTPRIQVDLLQVQDWVHQGNPRPFKKKES